MASRWRLGESSRRKLRKTLPKNGEFRDGSVGFCRLRRCNVVCSEPSPLLTAVLSQLGSCTWNIHRWHPVCSLIGHLKDWLPGVAGTDPRLGYRFGASITRRGLAPAPFFILEPAVFLRDSRALPSLPIRTGFPARPFTYTLFPTSFRLKTFNWEL